MFPFMIPLLGAAGGALLNKKDPLKGALMGGGLAAGGGALLGAGGLGAAASAAAPAAAGSAAGGAPAAGGLMGMLDTAGAYAKPIAQVAGAAGNVSGLLAQPPAQPQMPVNQGGPGVGQAMQGLLTQPDETQMAEARKRMQMGLLGGGYYG